MKRVLYAWELGWQLSHLSNIEMLARGLFDAGHDIAVAARELHGALHFFSGMRVQYYQAPFKQGPSPQLPAYLSYAHLLHASGFADPRELAVLLSAWVGVLQSFDPDVIVFDHSPTALLASRGFDVKRVLVGSGFLIPATPPDEPLGVFPDVSRSSTMMEALRRDEEAVLQVANQSAAAFGMAPMDRLGALYDEVDDRILLTFPELDVFAERRSSEYSGVWAGGQAEPIEWQSDAGHRIFAYLQPFPGCEDLLGALAARDAEVVVFAPALPAEVRGRFESDRFRFRDEIVDLFSLAGGCDLFLSHAAHTSVATTLLGGVPQLMIPIYREQILTARRVAELGAGRIAPPNAKSWASELASILDVGGPREAAGEFARAHAQFDREGSARAATERLMALL